MNNGTRIIKTQTPDVFTAEERPDEIEIPVFYLDGPVSVSESGTWSPASNVLLTSWYIQSSTIGTANTEFQLITGDNIFGNDEALRKIVLAPDKLKANGDLITGYIDHIVLSKSNWIKVACTAAGGHNDVTVQIYGRRV